MSELKTKEKAVAHIDITDIQKKIYKKCEDDERSVHYVCKKILKDFFNGKLIYTK